MSWFAWFSRRRSPSNGARWQLIKPLGPRDYTSYWCRWRRCGNKGASLVKWYGSVPWSSILFRYVRLYIAVSQSISHEILHVRPSAAENVASLLADVVRDPRRYACTSVNPLICLERLNQYRRKSFMLLYRQKTLEWNLNSNLREGIFERCCPRYPWDFFPWPQCIYFLFISFNGLVFWGQSIRVFILFAPYNIKNVAWRWINVWNYCKSNYGIIY
jgi:hypothetical protein